MQLLRNQHERETVFSMSDLFCTDGVYGWTQACLCVDFVVCVVNFVCNRKVFGMLQNSCDTQTGKSRTTRAELGLGLVRTLVDHSAPGPHVGGEHQNFQNMLTEPRRCAAPGVPKPEDMFSVDWLWNFHVLLLCREFTGEGAGVLGKQCTTFRLRSSDDKTGHGAVVRQQPPHQGASKPKVNKENFGKTSRKMVIILLWGIQKWWQRSRTFTEVICNGNIHFKFLVFV